MLGGYFFVEQTLRSHPGAPLHAGSREAAPSAPINNIVEAGMLKLGILIESWGNILSELRAVQLLYVRLESRSFQRETVVIWRERHALA